MDNKIKKLAKLTIKTNKIDKSIASYALSHLSRKELLKYLFYLKNLLARESITVISRFQLNRKVQDQIRKIYKDKRVYFEIDESTGEGIKVIINDTVIDLTVENYVAQAFENIKEEI